MIEAAVIVLVAGFSLVIGYLWGAKVATESVIANFEESDIELKIVGDAFEEALQNPDTYDDTVKLIRNFNRGLNHQPLTHGFKVENKKVVPE